MPLPEHLSNRHQSERRTRTIMTKGRVSSWRWCPAFCAISACSFTGEYGILGLVQQIGTCRGEAPPSCCARPFCRLKAPLGLSLLRYASQTRICGDKNMTNPLFISAYNARAEYGAHATPPPSPRGLAPSGDWGSNSGFFFIPQKILLQYLRCAWHPSHTSPRRSSLRIRG